MLSARVGIIPGAVGQRWNGIATTCHFATVYYLFLDEFSREPKLDDYMNLGDPTGVVQQIARLGTQVNNPGRAPLVFAAGAVVIFMDGQAPGHSCVAKQINLLGGYNQTNWFTGAGVDHGYSTHTTDQIRWRDSMFHKNQVRGNVPDHWCRLVKVPEITAKAKLREIVMS